MVIEIVGIKYAVVVGREVIRLDSLNPDHPTLVIDGPQLVAMMDAYQIGQDLRAGMAASRRAVAVADATGAP